ncbi:MAG: type II toxin-antitoxin system VapC family toxin [Thermoanaerobaculaceae bacterium]
MAVRHRLVKPRTLVLSPLGWGSLGELRRRGMARTQVDMLIAATALGQRLPLVAHNVRGFEGLGVPLVSSFSP